MIAQTNQNVRDVRSFLRTANYYRRLCQNFVTIATLLHCFIDKGARFQWDPVHQKVFDRIKEILYTAPTLAFPIPEAQLVFDTDAGLNGIGAVLSRIEDGEEKVLAYASKVLFRNE